MYNYNHLYYFYITVRSGGVTCAAKHLLISQPSLSGQIKVLEDYLQIKLFKKVGRKNELTPEGSSIYDFCRQMFELSEEMHESIVERASSSSRKLYIGVSNEVANSFVVEVISHFLSKYEDDCKPKVTMISAPHNVLINQLRFREIDVMISSSAMTHSELINLQKVEIPVHLLFTSKNKQAIKVSISNFHLVLESIKNAGIDQWVVPSNGLKLRKEINKFFELNHIKGRIVFESDVMESLTRSVVDEIGIAFLPLIYVPKEIENKSLFSFGPKNGYWLHKIWIGSHIKNKDNCLIKSLSDSYKEVCNPS